MIDGQGFYLWGNTGGDFLRVVVVFFLLLIVFKIFHSIILNRLAKFARRTKTDLDETFIEILRKLRPPFYAFLAFFIALRSIIIPPVADKVLLAILLIWVGYQAVISLGVLVDYAVDKRSKKEDDSGTKSALTLIGKIAKGVLWVIAVLFVFSNLGVNVTSLMAGLGIGGVAVALALQNVLSDLFSSFSIYFDKPFVPGDFIVVGDDMGVVEYVGIKTTRLRALRGEEIVISNQELTSARVHNFKKLSERRIVFSFGVTYDTSDKSLRKIPEIVKDIVESVDLAKFDRAHFHNFGDSSLDFEVVYYIKSSDYNDYMNVQQEINLKLKEALEKIKVDMAFPTRTIYMQKT